MSSVLPRKTRLLCRVVIANCRLPITARGLRSLLKAIQEGVNHDSEKRIGEC